MTVREMTASLEGEVKAGGNLSRTVAGCYVSDLLSDVLANSSSGDIWITQHTHPNIVAVASVKDLSCVVVVGGKNIDRETLAKADTEDVTLITCGLSSFEAAGRIYNLLGSGVKN